MVEIQQQSMEFDNEAAAGCGQRKERSARTMLRKLLPASPWRHRRRSLSALRVTGGGSDASSALTSPPSSPRPMPRFTRLAASLRLPGYHGRGTITDTIEQRRGRRWNGGGGARPPVVESNTLPYSITYRSIDRRRSADEEQRVLEYRNDLKRLSGSPSLSRLAKTTLDTHLQSLDQNGTFERREDAVTLAVNEKQLEQIESKFNSRSSLNLLDSCSTSDVDEMRRFSSRRRTSSIGSGAVVTKLPASASAVARTNDGETAETSAGECCNQLQMSSPKHMESAAVRTYLKEGSVVLAAALQTQDRYLFLFSDLLLVAKEKGLNSYKLKEKVRLSEVWLRSGGIEQVAEFSRAPPNELAFVIGWPTGNYAAIFPSQQQRDEWYGLLEATIQEEKDREMPKVTTVRVHLKNGQKKNEYRNLTINNIQCGRDLVRLAVLEFDLNEDEEYQIWVYSVNENGAYPLYGHESPFAIVMSHVRDAIANGEYPAVASSSHGGGGEQMLATQLENLADVPLVNAKLKFTLKPKNPATTAPSARKTARQRRSGVTSTAKLVNQFKRKVLQKADSVGDSSYADANSVPSGGQLFGRTLNSITHDNAVPPPLMKILRHIAKEGVMVEGIFRKPPKQSTVKQLKEALDEGMDIQLESDHYPLVSASLLKDFLRHLPGKLLLCDLYYEWMSVIDEPDPAKKLYRTKRLITGLPPTNYQLLRHLLCVLRMVADMEQVNQMSSNALAVCIGPSLLEKPNGADMNDSVKRIPALTQYLIDRFVELFGTESALLFEDCQMSTVPAPATSPVDTTVNIVSTPSPKQDSSEESDFSHLHQDTSSVDSLAALHRAEGQQLLVKGNPTNESRDSGLSDVHYLTDDTFSSPAAATARTNAGVSLCSNVTVLSPVSSRGYSHSDPTDSPSTQPLFVGDLNNNKNNSDLSSTTSHRKRTATGTGVMPLTRQMSESATGFATAVTVNGVRIDGTADDVLVNGKFLQSSPSEMYTSVSGSLSDYSGASAAGGSRSTPLRNSKRLTIGTLHRTESGEHLVLSEPTPNATSVNSSDVVRVRSATAAQLTLSLPSPSTDYKEPEASSPDNESLPSSRNSAASSSVDSVPPIYMARDSPYRKGIRKQNSGSAEEQSSAASSRQQSPAFKSEPNSGSIVIKCNSVPVQKRHTPASGHPPSKDTSMRQHSETSSSGASSLSSLLSSDSVDVVGVALPSAHLSTIGERKISPPLSSSVFATTAAVYERQHQNVVQKQMIRGCPGVGTNNAVYHQHHDSSTVTEASSDDEDKTPVVSRETSRAKEYQDKAKVMFHHQHNGQQQPNVISTTNDSKPYARPLYSWETQQTSTTCTTTTVADLGTSSSPFNSKESRYRPVVTVRPQHLQQPVVEQMRDESAMLVRERKQSTEAARPGRTTKPRLPSYEETMRRRSLRSGDANVVEEIESARLRVSDALRRKTSTDRPPVLSSATVSARGNFVPSPIVSKAQPHQRRIAVPSGVVSENRERFTPPRRRKTLGGEEYQILGDYPPAAMNGDSSGMTKVASCEKLNSDPQQTMTYSTSALPPRIRPRYTTEGVTQHRNPGEPMLTEISWSVNRLRSMFDAPPTAVAVSSPTAEQLRPATSLSSRPSISRRLTTEVVASTPAGPIWLSDAQGNYPVVKPPPLIPCEPVESKQMMPLQIARNVVPVVRAASTVGAAQHGGPRVTTTQNNPLKSGLVRSLATNFEPLSAVGRKSRDESYV